MKILILDDDYNLVAEAWADEKDINLREVLPESYIFSINEPIHFKPKYELKVSLKKAPFGDFMARFYQPALDPTQSIG